MGRSLGLSAFLLLLVVCLGLGVTSGGGDGADTVIAAGLGMRVGDTPDAIIAFWQWVSWIGGGIQRYLIVGFLAILLGFLKHSRAGLTLAVLALVSNLASDGLKMAFSRARPDLVPHLDHASSFAYPSGHATSAALVYLLFALLIPTQRRGLWLSAAIVLTLMTGVSRVLLGVHWPSDVIAGWMLGAAFAVLGARLMERADERRAGGRLE